MLPGARDASLSAPERPWARMDERRFLEAVAFVGAKE
jgi:hypothetical protein